jgi:hypothetical protein
VQHRRETRPQQVGPPEAGDDHGQRRWHRARH